MNGIRRDVTVCRDGHVHSLSTIKAIMGSSTGTDCLKSPSITSTASHRLKEEVGLHWLLLHALVIFAQLLPFRVMKCFVICTDDPTSFETTRSSFLQASKKDYLRILKIMSSFFPINKNSVTYLKKWIYFGTKL